MKNKASTFLKQVFSFVVTMVKAKSIAAKTKSGAVKARILVLGLLRNKKLLMTAINHKIHVLIGQEKEAAAAADEETRKELDPIGGAIVLYNAPEEDDYPDLRHSLFDLEEDDEDLEEDEFSLEDEIDRAADVFIKRFHKQMMLQKLDSFKRYREMLARGL